MQLDTIISTILSAAAFLKKPVQDAAGQSVKEIFDAARYYLKRKFGPDSDGTKVLELAAEKPESVMRRAMLVEEAHAAGLGSDEELARLAAELATHLPPIPESSGQNVQVTGRANQVVVAGRDVIHAERFVHRNAIAPDDRHLTAGERNQVRALIAELASLLVGRGGRPNFSAGHRMLQRRFGVMSYALIPRPDFGDTIRYLKRQCAIHRARAGKAA